MTWLKYGLGGFGAMLIGIAGLMVMGRLQVSSGQALSPDGTIAGLVALCAGLVALVRFAPAGFGNWFRNPVKDGVADAPLELARPETVPLLESAVKDDGLIFDRTVQLAPVLPTAQGGQASSWIGGAPQLPVGTEWPMLAGKPAQFLAQIDCATLPDDLWGGLGPRQGALVFFRATRIEGGRWPVRVLHVQGALAEAQAPDTKTVHTRWPLQIAGSEAGQMEESQTDIAPNWGKLHDVDLTDPAYQPFDWPSAGILLAQMKTLIETCAGRLGPDPQTEERAQLTEAALGLADLTEAFLAARSEMAFSDELKRLLIEGLTALTLPGRDARAKDADVQGLPLTQHRCVTAAYFAPFERYCRRSFAADPGSLPAAQRELFEPLWAHNARHETGSMGEQGPFQSCPDPDADSLLLLELPSSELLGWTFGEARSLRFLVCPEALARNDLAGVWTTAAT